MIYKGKPVNFSPRPWPRSQDLTDLLSINFAINILPRLKFQEWGSLVGQNPYYYRLDPTSALDVDFPKDFEYCELLYKNRLETRIESS